MIINELFSNDMCHVCGQTPCNCTHISEGEVVAFPKKHRGDLDSVNDCPKCGGDLQGGKYQGHEVKVCMPCKQVYLPPNSGIDQQGNKIKEMDGDSAGRSGGEFGKEHTGKQMKAKDAVKHAAKWLTEPQGPQQELVRNRAKNIADIRKNKDPRKTMGLDASLEQHADDKMKELGHKFKGVAEDDAGDVEQRMIAKMEKEKQRLAKLKQTDPEAYKREMEKRKTSSRIPPVSTFEGQGVAEGTDERKRNAMWAQITSYEKRAKETKNDIKKDHLMKMASELRAKLPTTDEEKLSESLAALAEALGNDAVFVIDGEHAYQQVMDQFGDVIEWSGDYMVAPRDVFNRIEEVVFDAGGDIEEITGSEWPVQEAEHEFKSANGPVSVTTEPGRTVVKRKEWDSSGGSTGPNQGALNAPAIGGTRKSDYDSGDYSDERSMDEAEQQKGADYRDPPEADYGDEYQAMVKRMKQLAGAGPLKTVHDPARRVYKNVPTAVQPKK